MRPWFIAVTLALALVGNLLPVSGVALALRPDFVALVLLYWCIQEPRYVGVGIAWAIGLLMDVGDATLFGQHALAYAFLAYAAEYFRRRVLRFPLWQQAAQVAVLLGLCAALVLLVRYVGGAPLPRWTYAVPPLVGALLWPAVTLVMQWRSDLSSRRRRYDGRSRLALTMARFLFASRVRSRSDDATFGSHELRNPEREVFLFRRRLSIAGMLVALALLGLFVRFFYLQVVQHTHYQTLAETNRIAIVPIVPNRGVIRDRNGIVLAQSYSAYTLEIQPARVKNLEETIDALAEIIDVQPRDRRRFKKLLDESKNFESLPLRTRLSDSEVARFAVNRYRFPGVEIKARLFRQYPYGEVASHVVGYIGRINDRDVVRIDEWDEAANYKGSDYIGKVGIELSYERELHGTTGVEEVEVDAGGRAVRTLSRSAPTSGNDLTLSLDIKLQEVAEAAFGTRRGALVAIDPANGEILAMVSKPASIRTCSSTASTPRTGSSSTIRRTSRS